MGRNTSVSLGNHFEKFVDDKVATGRFKNASEVLRAGLRLLEDEENEEVFEITPEQEASILEGLEDSKAGRVVSHEEVYKKVQEWATK